MLLFFNKNSAFDIAQKIFHKGFYEHHESLQSVIRVQTVILEYNDLNK